MPVSVVFGASGAVGRFLLPRLLAEGHEVVALSREVRTSTHPALRWVLGELPSRVPALPAADTIFSLGPLEAFAAWFAVSADAQASGVVAIGSSSAETKKTSVDPAERALAERLREAERRLAAAADARGVASVVLRPTLIYGAGLDRSLTPITRFARRTRVFPYVAPARGLRQPVHADDLAGACVALAHASRLRQRVYEVGGGERVAFGVMLARVRESLPFATIALPLPVALARIGAALPFRPAAFRAASRAALERLREDLVVDDAAAAADFGWAPRDFRPTPADWTTPALP